MLENEQLKMLEKKQNKDKEKALKKTNVCCALSLALFGVAIHSVSFISVQYLGGLSQKMSSMRGGFLLLPLYRLHL